MVFLQSFFSATVASTAAACCLVYSGGGGVQGGGGSIHTVDCCLLYSIIISLVCCYCHCVCRLLFVCVFSVSIEFRFIVPGNCTRSSTFISKTRHKTWQSAFYSASGYYSASRHCTRQLGIVLGNSAVYSAIGIVLAFILFRARE